MHSLHGIFLEMISFHIFFMSSGHLNFLLHIHTCLFAPNSPNWKRRNKFCSRIFWQIRGKIPDGGG